MGGCSGGGSSPAVAFTASKMLACRTFTKLLNSSTFLVMAVCAATAEELETGIDPAVFRCSGTRNLSRPFSRRSNAISVDFTLNCLASSAQNWTGLVVFGPCATAACSSAAAAPVADPPAEFCFPFCIAMAPNRIQVPTAGRNHAELLQWLHQVTKVLCPAFAFAFELTGCGGGWSSNARLGRIPQVRVSG